jgi:ubiquinol-cytochrome c reductase cytochrome c subunit
MTLRQLRAAVLFAVVSMPVSSAIAQTTPPLPAETSASAPPGNAANGKVLYGKIGCYQCHSEQGQGGTQGPRLGPRPIAFQAFLRYVRTPRGEMPPYKAKVMSDKDVADVYAFLQALSPPPPLTALPLLQP